MNFQNNKIMNYKFVLYGLLIYSSIVLFLGVKHYNNNVYISPSIAMLVLVVIPLVLLVLTAGILIFASRLIATYFILVVISVILSLWMFEYYVQIKRGSDDKIIRVLSERKTRLDSYPAVFSQSFLNEDWDNFNRERNKQTFIPLADISNSNTIYCKEEGDFLVYESDEYGWNNPKGLWSAPADIVAIGDSYTHGACVPVGNDYVSKLRVTIASTVNLGKGGNGPLAELASLKEYASKLRPKIVIWNYSTNDISKDLLGEQKIIALSSYMNEGYTQHLMERKLESEMRVKEYLNDLILQHQKTSGEWGGKFKNIITMVEIQAMFLKTKFIFTEDYDVDDLNLDLYKAIIKEAKKTVEKWGGQLVILETPFTTSIYLTKNSLQYSRAVKHNQRMLSLFNSLGLRVIDLNERFSVEPNIQNLFAWTGFYYGHPNSRGYDVFAEEVIHYLNVNCKIDFAARKLNSCQ